MNVKILLGLFFFSLLANFACKDNMKNIMSGKLTELDKNMYYLHSTEFLAEERQSAPLKNVGSINVKDFGALGNGLNDDTEAFKKAIGYIQESRKNIISPFFFTENKNNIFTKLYIPNGLYIVTSTLKIPSYVTIEGETTEGAILQCKNPNIDLLDVSIQTERDKFDNFVYNYTTIKNLTIAGKHFNTNPFAWKLDYNKRAKGNGILIKNNIRLKLIDVRISGFENAGFKSDNSYYLILDRVSLDNNCYGIIASNSTTTMMANNCEIRMNSVGIHIVKSFSNHFNQCIIEGNMSNFLPLPLKGENNQIINKSGQGVNIEESFNNTFKSCYFEENIVSIIINKSKNNIFEYSLFCPTNDFSLAKGYINTVFLSFFGVGNIGNKFINNYFVELDENLYPSKTVEIRSSLYGHDNEIITSSSEDFNKFINANKHWMSVFTNDRKNAPAIINSATNDVFLNLEKK